MYILSYRRMYFKLIYNLKLPLASDCSSFPYATGLSNNAVCPVLFEIFLLILLQGCM